MFKRLFTRTTPSTPEVRSAELMVSNMNYRDNMRRFQASPLRKKGGRL